MRPIRVLHLPPPGEFEPAARHASDATAHASASLWIISDADVERATAVSKVFELWVKLRLARPSDGKKPLNCDVVQREGGKRNDRYPRDRPQRLAGVPPRLQ